MAKASRWRNAGDDQMVWDQYQVQVLINADAPYSNMQHIKDTKQQYY